MKISFKVWLEEGGSPGPLRRGAQPIAPGHRRSRSLAQAAKKMNMSYRAAWGPVKASEDRLGFSLAEKDTTLGKRGGLRLTTEGKDLLEKFNAIHQTRATGNRAGARVF